MSERMLTLEAVVQHEFVTYSQAGAMLGVSYATVRVLQIKGRLLNRRGNPARVPLFPAPYRISGVPGAVVFRRSEVEAFIAERAALGARLLQQIDDVPGRS